MRAGFTPVGEDRGRSFPLPNALAFPTNFFFKDYINSLSKTQYVLGMILPPKFHLQGLKIPKFS